MIIGISPIGISYFSGEQFTSGEYTSITFYGGNTGIILDSVWGRYMELTESYFDSLTPITYNPTWTTNTYLMALFNHSLSGGNISNIDEYLTTWSIYRLTDNNTQLDFLNDIDIELSSYKDYTAILGHKYQYYIFAKNDDVMSPPLVSNVIQPEYYAHYLIDVTNNITYVLNINVESGALTQNEEYTMHNVNNKYNVFMKGNNQYQSATIKGILVCSMDVEGTINNSVSVLEDFNNFVHNDDILKYYKNRKGQIFNVFTSDSNMSVLNDNIGSQPMVVSVTITEKGDVL